MGKENVWNIMRLRQGNTLRDAAGFLGPEHAGEEYQVTFWCFAVWNDTHKIMVDTGISLADEHPWYTDIPIIFTPEERLERQLADNLGWTFDDIDTVIHTHLHYDHTGHNREMRNAVFYVQKEEYEWALTCPATGFGFAYNKSNYDKTSVPYYNWRFVEGEQLIYPGIMVFPTPGHGHMHQSVLVNTKDGAACITGDAANTLVSLEKELAVGPLQDAYAQMESYKKIKQVSELIITAHDINSDTCYDHQTDGWPRIN